MTNRDWTWGSPAPESFDELNGMLNPKMKALENKLAGLQGSLGVFNVQDFGATVGGIRDAGPAIRAAVAEGGDVLFPGPGTYLLDLQSDADTIQPSTGQRLFGTNNASIKFGRDDGYIPAIAVVDVNDVVISGLNFINTGTLDGVESISAVEVSHFGKSRLPRFFNSAVFLDGSTGCTVENSRCEGLTQSTGITYWIYSAVNEEILIQNIHGHDCSIVVGTGDGTHVVDTIRAGRLNSDNSIPGHVVYMFASRSIVSNITDDGLQTGTGDTVSHTVKLDTAVNTIVHGIVSRRAAGVFSSDGIKNCHVSDITWEDREDEDINVAAVFINSDSASEFNVITDITLRTTRDIQLLRIKGENNVVTGATLIRKATSTPTKPFIASACKQGRIEAVLINEGTEAITSLADAGSNFHNNSGMLTLMGDVITPSYSRTASQGKNTIIYNQQPLPGTLNIAKVPLVQGNFLAGSATFEDRTTHWSSIPTWVNWTHTVTGTPASVNVDTQLPMQGAFLVNITLMITTRLQARTGTYLIVFDDQSGSNDFTNVQLLGSEVEKGASVFGAMTVAVTKFGLVNVTATLTSGQNYIIETGGTMLNSWIQA